MSETEEGKEEEALGDVVEEELAATSQAVEEAARRIQVSLSHALLHVYGDGLSSFTLVRETGQTFRTGSTNYNKLSKSLHETKSNILHIREVKKSPSAHHSCLTVCLQEMLAKSREDDSGVKLEVNERFLDSCTGLMKAIRTLIARARDLQGEIIGEGMVQHI